jgi:outer membrane protein insertion porin family
VRLIVVVCLLVAGTAVASPIVERIDIRGQRRADPDVIRLQVHSQIGAPIDALQLRADLRAIWRLGLFADVRITSEATPAGGVVVAFEVEERPTLRKVLVAGNQELGLDKLNDALDLQRDAIVDLAAVRKGRDKLLDLYRDHGFYLASVDLEVVPVSRLEVDVRYTIDEHAKVMVGDVDFIGNQALSTAELRAALATRRPGALSFMDDSGTFRSDAIERDLAIVIARYLDLGYATIKIGAPAFSLSRDKKRMFVTIPIDEGPRFELGKVEVTGDVLADARVELASQTGAHYSRSKIEHDREAIETRYRDRGYAHASVKPRMRVDPASHRIALAFEVARGARTFIEHVKIRGNTKTRDEVIRREMKIAEGDLYDGTAIERSKRRVTALGFFESVTIATSRGSTDDFVDLTVEVRERATGTFQVGAGFSSVENFLLQGQVAYNNFAGRGQSVSLQAQISSLRRMFMFRFAEPHFLDTDWTFGFDIYNQSRGLGAVSRNATGGAMTWGYQLSDHTSAYVSYKLEDVGIASGSGGFANLGASSIPLAALDTANLLRGGWTSSLRTTLAWDSRDNRLFPSDGWYATAFAEYAGRLTGSENQFLRWGGFVRHYEHIGGPFVLRLNGEFGMTTSLDGQGVPLTERYLLGGMTDIRGYQLRSLGPILYSQRPGDPGRELDQLALGGNVQIIGNAEVEFPISRQIGLSGVAFFDIGNAYNLEDRFCTNGGTSRIAAVDTCTSPSGMLGGLRKSVGLGVRWLSPIGPLRLEWGIPLDLRPGETPAGVQFSIGSSF